MKVANYSSWELGGGGGEEGLIGHFLSCSANGCGIQKCFNTAESHFLHFCKLGIKFIKLLKVCKFKGGDINTLVDS